MQLRVLGPLDITIDGRAVPLRSAKQRVLLAVLISAANAPVASQRLIDALWDDPPPSAQENLRLYVYHLRRALEDGDRVVRHPSGYMLTIRPGELDAGLFEELVAQGAQTLAAGDAGTASQLLTRALSLWRGPAYGNLADHPAVLAAAGWLEESRLRATELRIQADLALGRHDGLIGELTALVSQHPTLERFRSQLMLCLHRATWPGISP
ncbi:AfsR/SARP family transcriptional regulator [Nonomuraea sp. NEAU-A123]|uniref:AfsR/SARP family transcriptional regulator n=1 Tax=Nonomuraea sp. NEAU-A123 TaxID=2839649 RepID=UPI001BE490F1|nr:AfsR/SARP family transcriptional regulator [Nonomuraea sp. NEAU-A123]MBT2231788.1 AfsR/SARP family transcriptional regulator [Nonomuraea sp. NEAU-A123]